MKIPSLLLCANWKMHKNIHEAKQYIHYMIQNTHSEDQKHFIFFVPALTSLTISEALQNHNFQWGGQNCYFEDQGSFTGENSPKVLKEMGAGYCLVGHSERRKLFSEGEEVICKKIQSLLKHSICPVLCIGETKEEKEKGLSFKTIRYQLRTALESVISSSVIGIAYEPVWAIGSGQSAEPAYINDVQQFIHQQCESFGKKVFVLYGGSVNEQNIKQLSHIQGLNGFLVGGNSLKPDHFLSLFELIKS